VLTIQRTKSLQGKLELPPSPDLFLLAAITSIAAKRPVRIHPVKESPLINKWASLIASLAAITWEDDVCCIEPRGESGSREIVFKDDEVPYRDLTVFLALGARIKVLFSNVTEKRLQGWREQARRLGCLIDITQSGDLRGLAFVSGAAWESVSLSICEDDVHPLLGLLLGLRAKYSFQIGFNLSTPLRSLAKLFGFEIGVKRDIGEAERDPIVRRMRLQAHQRLSSQDQLFTVGVDFSTSQPTGRLDVVLPGDEVLLGLFLTAKSLVHKGSLVIDNAPLDPWAMPVLGLMRKMGCKLSAQESSDTAFGPSGMISFQKFELTGQKTDGAAQSSFAYQIPAMAVLSAFAEGESVFRRLDDLRLSDPDAIEMIESCLKAMQVKFGDMPDGLVIKGGHDYDGFDLIEPLPAHIAGAFAIAGLNSMGSTTINDDRILERWPTFDKILLDLCEFRT
jgi:hypothetical protein